MPVTPGQMSCLGVVGQHDQHITDSVAFVHFYLIKSLVEVVFVMFYFVFLFWVFYCCIGSLFRCVLFKEGSSSWVGRDEERIWKIWGEDKNMMKMYLKLKLS